MARRNYKQAQAPMVDAVSMSEWAKQWHPIWYSFGVFVLAWLGPNFTLMAAIGIAVSFFLIVQGIRFYMWYKQRLFMLAEKNQSNPGVWPLYKDYKTEVRKFNMIRKQFAIACRTFRIQGEAGNKKPPYLRNLATTVDLDIEAEIVTAGGNGVTIGDIIEHANSIAEICGAQDLVVRRTTSVGHAELKFYFTDPMGHILNLEDVPMSPPETLAYGIRQDGSPAYINMHQSVLIGGLTRKGKSMTINDLIASAIQHKVYIDLRIADTKLIQFPAFGKNKGRQMGYVKIGDYRTDVKGCEEMFADVVKEKDTRSQSIIDQGIEQHQPTLKEPLIVVVIDEALDLNAILAKGSKGSIGNIAYTGSASDCVVWICAQLGDKNAIGDVRDLIPQAICYSVKTWQQADAVLGSFATQSGASCHTIGDAAGIGYSGSNDSAFYQKFRSANVTRTQFLELANGKVESPYTTAKDNEQQVAVYRARSFKDASGGRQLLYIGKTNNIDFRIKQHQEDAKKPWFADPSDPDNEVDYADLIDGMVWYPNNQIALLQEELAIKREKPLYNIVHNTNNPGRRKEPKGKVVVAENKKLEKAESKELKKIAKEIKRRKPAEEIVEEPSNIEILKNSLKPTKKVIWPLKPLIKNETNINGKQKVWGTD